MAYATSEPMVFPMVATMTTIQKFHADPVIGSTAVGFETRNPANGRISSEGSGIIAEFDRHRRPDAEVPDRAVEAGQERDDDLVDEREHGPAVPLGESG